MPRKRTAATERALALVAAGMTRYAAAKAEGLSLSTVYRAVKTAMREKERKAADMRFLESCKFEVSEAVIEFHVPAHNNEGGNKP